MLRTVMKATKHQKQKGKKFVGVWVDKATHTALAQVAAANMRTVSGEIRFQLEKLKASQ